MSILQRMLHTMIDEAERVARPVERTLKNGLHVSIEAKIDNFILEISRDTTYPSGKEWKTIIKHWPYYTTPPNADQCTGADNRMALRGKVTKRHMQQIPMM